MTKLQVAAAAAVLALFASGASAQGFNYDAYQPTTLYEAKAEFIEVARQPISGRPGAFLTSYFNQGGQRWRAQATYSGKSRPLDAEELKFVRDWLKSSQRDELADIFVDSHLFTLDGAEYWLPVQAPVAKFFPKELKPGDKIDLYLVEIGGTRRGDHWLWLPLVSEFRKIEEDASPP